MQYIQIAEIGNIDIYLLQREYRDHSEGTPDLCEGQELQICVHCHSSHWSRG